MSSIFKWIKKELMLVVSIVAAVISLFITPPSVELIKNIDWKTLATLFMMLTVLEGFKQENIFEPFIRFSKRIRTMRALSLFLIFCVFFSSMFVTNDVSLIIFVPLTIILFKSGNKEKYILPVISMENIAAVRGSLLTPFGSPQNLFLFGQSGVSAWSFMLRMLPLWVFSAGLLIVFVFILYRRNPHELLYEQISTSGATEINRNSDRIASLNKSEKNSDREETSTKPGESSGREETSTKPGENPGAGNKFKKLLYILLFIMVVTTIVTRTTLWPYIALVLAVAVLIFDRKILIKTDYVLLGTFLCFFVFSSQITANPGISGFLSKSVAGNEYIWSILLSQVISNVPASIVLYPFSTNLTGLLYGLDSAGLCTLIGSLASVINYRIYVREYPGNGGKFIKTFTLISLAFFAVVVVPQYFLCQVL